MIEFSSRLYKLERKSGTTPSFSLLGAKFRMMSETIPQYELSAILLGTELTFSIKKDPSKPTDFCEGLGVQVT